MSRAVQEHDSPLQRLRAAALWSFGELDSPENAANQLAALALDLQDEKMKELLLAGWRIMEDRLTRLAQEAIDEGELSGRSPAEQVGRILLATSEGTALAWSVAPEGSLLSRIADDLDAVLMAWRVD